MNAQQGRVAVPSVSPIGSNVPPFLMTLHQRRMSSGVVLPKLSYHFVLDHIAKTFLKARGWVLLVQSRVWPPPFFSLLSMH